MSDINHRFIAAVFDDFLHYEGTEWGDQLRAICNGYGMGEDYAGLTDQQMLELARMLRDHLEIAYEQGWLDGTDPHGYHGGPDAYYQQEFNRAKANFHGQHQKTWGKPNQATLSLIPEWMYKGGE